MSDLLSFLTSKEIIIIYIISGVACAICLLVYFIEKNNENIRKKNNTRELNKLVELVKEKVPEEEVEMYQEPIMMPITDSSLSVDEMINVEASDDNSLLMEEVKEYHNYTAVSTDNSLVESSASSVSEMVNNAFESTSSDYLVKDSVDKEEISYTSIEPNQEEAKNELKKLEEELINEENSLNIELNRFEEEQEKSAIISLDEFLEKSRRLYDANEVSQYADEGNEPISIQELNKDNKTYDEPFIIANVVEDENKQMQVEVIDNEFRENSSVNEAFSVSEELINNAVLDNVNNSEEKEVNIVIPNVSTYDPTSIMSTNERTFKSTPFISPIFGIERENSIDNDIALENTANYEKLDAELEKANNFVISLKDLQEKLD